MSDSPKKHTFNFVDSSKAVLKVTPADDGLTDAERNELAEKYTRESCVISVEDIIAAEKLKRRGHMRTPVIQETQHRIRQNYKYE